MLENFVFLVGAYCKKKCLTATLFLASNRSILLFVVASLFGKFFVQRLAGGGQNTKGYPYEVLRYCETKFFHYIPDASSIFSETSFFQ